MLISNRGIPILHFTFKCQGLKYITNKKKSNSKIEKCKVKINEIKGEKISSNKYQDMASSPKLLACLSHYFRQ